MLETLSLSLKVSNRHWKIYKKDFFANILPTLTEPIFFVLSFGIGLGAYLSKVNGMDYIYYIAPGLVISTALFTSFFESSYNFYVRLTYDGIYSAILTSPIGPREIIFGELIWMAFKGLFMATALSLVLAIFQLVQWKFLIFVPIVGALTSLTCGALGLIATSFVKNINQFQTIYTLIIAPMFFFSGIFFPLSQLPEKVQFFAKASPLHHAVIIVQELLWSRPSIESFLFHGSILLVMAIALSIMAYKRIYPKLYE
jgi:lipooligosaccharide transport system permease protein